MATADVYAGDIAAPDLLRESATDVFLLAIEADAEPDILARVANVLILANTVPRSASLQRKSSEYVHIEVEMERLGAKVVDLIRRKLLQLTCVTSVELTVRNAAQRALE